MLGDRIKKGRVAKFGRIKERLVDMVACVRAEASTWPIKHLHICVIRTKNSKTSIPSFFSTCPKPYLIEQAFVILCLYHGF
jgi:hypothetical protein